MTYDEILANTPTDMSMAENYPELLRLWRAQHSPDFLDLAEGEFDAWDKSVQSLLKPAERAFYSTGLRGLDMSVLDFRKVSRANHLTKILVHRQGIKTTNGFNG